MKAITTKYLPATNTKGARIAAFDGDGNRITVSYDHRCSAQGAHAGAAIALCEKMGWKPYFSSGWLKGAVYVHVLSAD